MVRKTLLMALAMVLVAATAQAQDSNLEISATAGYTFSDGVSGQEDFLRVDPADAFSWGLRLGYLLNENNEIGVLFNMQSTTLDISNNSESATLGDMSVFNYHAYYTYLFGSRDARARPYLLIGLGATQFGSVDATLGDQQQEVDGGTKFSASFGLGAKINMANPKWGLRVEARYTPTYIKSDPGGWWCGYWGCYVTEDPQYANQFELSAGVIFRP